MSDTRFTSKFPVLEEASRTLSTTNVTRTATTSPTLATRERVVVVDLSEETAKAQVVREGYQVPAARLNPQKTEFLLDGLIQIAPQRSPRVLGQSIPPGTKVTRGVAIDLILAPAEAVPFDILEEPHEDLKGRTLDTVLSTVLADPEVRESILRHDRPDDVPETEKQRIVQAFGEQQVNVDDADETRNFRRAFESARSALAFK